MQYLALALCSPLIGSLARPHNIRLIMIGGACLSATGCIGLGMIPSFHVAISMYFLLGMGASILAIISPVAIVTWRLAQKRAIMLALINLPIATMLMPFIISTFLPITGRMPLLVALGLSFIVIVPTFLLLPRFRGTSDQQDRRSGEIDTDPLPSARSILRIPNIWLLSVGMGLMAGGASIYMVHIVPFATGLGLSIRGASALISVYTAVGMLGSLGVGWAADRYGATRLLAAANLVHGLLWIAIPFASPAFLFVIASLMGVAVVPIGTLHGAASAEIFPANVASKAMGLSYAIKTPFLVGFAPAAALIYQHSGGYEAPFLVNGLLLLGACVTFVYLTRSLSGGRRRPRPGAGLEAA